MADRDIVVVQERTDGDFDETVITPAEGVLAFKADGSPEIKRVDDPDASVRLGNLTLLASRPDIPSNGDMWAEDDGYIYLHSGGSTIRFE